MRRAFSRRTIAARLASVAAGEAPWSKSLPPSATMQTSVSAATEKSSRARPSAAVSPETPAPRTIALKPSLANSRCSCAGNACSAGSPRPAVIESPRIATTLGCAASAGLEAAAARATSSRRRMKIPSGARAIAATYVGQNPSRGRMYDASQPSAPLAIDGVWLTLPSAAGPVEILRGVDFSVAASERVCVVGPSGSGKSSLIAVAAGLERPTRGCVRLLGKDLARLGEDGRARLRRGRVSLVFQAFHLLPNMTAEENVAAPLEIAGGRGAATEARRWLERVGLSARLKHYPHQLSGGEQQRVALARALAAGPSLLFADEPTGNLDQDNARQVS